MTQIKQINTDKKMNIGMIWVKQIKKTVKPFLSVSSAQSVLSVYLTSCRLIFYLSVTFALSIA